jgi:hypothetical protein
MVRDPRVEEKDGVDAVVSEGVAGWCKSTRNSSPATRVRYFERKDYPEGTTMRNQPAMWRDMPPETERHCRRPTPQEVVSGRAYMDPRVRATASYVAGDRDGAAPMRGSSAALVDARVDSRAYLSRTSRPRRA